jgi:hypothetical protein
VSCGQQHPRSAYLVSGNEFAGETGLDPLTLEQIARREGISPAWICSCDEVFYDLDAVAAIRGSVAFLTTWAIDVLKQPLPEADHHRLVLLAFEKTNDQCLTDYFRLVGTSGPRSALGLPTASD